MAEDNEDQKGVPIKQEERVSPKGLTVEGDVSTNEDGDEPGEARKTVEEQKKHGYKDYP